MKKNSIHSQSDLQRDRTYHLILGIAKVMDKCYLDPVIGFLLAGAGDTLTTVMTLPYLYFSLFKVKSVPLTLAVLCNALLDMLIGMVPFFIGDVLDVFYRSYSRSSRLITGFVEKDEAVMKEVNRKAWLMGFAVVLLSCLLYGLFKLVFVLLSNGYEWLVGLWG